MRHPRCRVTIFKCLPQTVEQFEKTLREFLQFISRLSHGTQTGKDRGSRDKCKWPHRDSWPTQVFHAG